MAGVSHILQLEVEAVGVAKLLHSGRDKGEHLSVANRETAAMVRWAMAGARLLEPLRSFQSLSWTNAMPDILAGTAEIEAGDDKGALDIALLDHEELVFDLIHHLGGSRGDRARR